MDEEVMQEQTLAVAGGKLRKSPIAKLVKRLGGEVTLRVSDFRMVNLPGHAWRTNPKWRSFRQVGTNVRNPEFHDT